MVQWRFTCVLLSQLTAMRLVFRMGLVFADNQQQAEREGGARLEAYFPGGGWRIAGARVEEVQRQILERAAVEILGYPTRNH